VETISQVESYEAPFDEKTGRDKVVKVNDDLVDPIRYVFNTLIRVSMWEGERADGEEDEQGRLFGNEATEDSQRDLARNIIEAYTGEPYEEDSFWNNNSGFFN